VIWTGLKHLLRALPGLCWLAMWAMIILGVLFVAIVIVSALVYHSLLQLGWAP